jgi:site-specific recombinase XerD
MAQQVVHRSTDVVGWQTMADAYLNADIDSENTRRAYRRHLHAAFAAMSVETVADITGPMLAAHRARVMESGLSPASQGQALAALRSFLAWSRAMGAHSLSDDVIKTALRPPRATVQTPYTTLTNGEVARLLVAAATPRDRAVIAIMVGAGLRVAEVVNLDVSDVRDDADGETVLYVRAGKGRKDRAVPIQADVARIINDYLKATKRKRGGTGPLLLANDRAVASREKRRMTARAVGYMVERTAATAGIDTKKVNPHSMRHTFAIRALRAGGNVVAVSKLLGHADLATTQRYVDHLATAELRAAVPSLPSAK